MQKISLLNKKLDKNDVIDILKIRNSSNHVKLWTSNLLHGSDLYGSLA